MLNNFGGIRLRLIILFLAFVVSSIAQSFTDTLILANFSNSVVFPLDKEYRNSVVMANYDCKFLCPYVVLRPVSTSEVAKAISIAKTFNSSLSVRGGGHGYTCQGSKDGGIMLDMRRLKGIEIHNYRNHDRNYNGNGKNTNGNDVDSGSDSVDDKGNNDNDKSNENTSFNKVNSKNQMSMTLGTGYTWGEILKHIKKIDKNLITVHGQCTSVGVAGFSLHGGVHFGGLSELYGLASDNIIGLTAVVANGSTVELTSNTCIIDGISVIYSPECRGLFFAFRGAGSSYGVVTSLTIKLYVEPKIQSALSILSLNINDPKKAQVFLSSYMEKVPEEVSLTFFGLDAYFKAYSFTLLFSTKKWNAFIYDLFALLPVSKDPIIHFIVEASWPTNLKERSSEHSSGFTENNIGNNSGISNGIKRPVSKDFILHKLQSIHNNKNDNSKLVVMRDWLLTPDTWNVPSYDLVWGAGHSYGGATVITDKKYEKITIEKSFERMKLHENKKTGKCSDCVIVFHRIGEKLRNGNKEHRQNTKNNNGKNEKKNEKNEKNGIDGKNEEDNDKNTEMEFESFNPFRQNASLWVEMDCGHFYPQRDSFPSCQEFISDTQKIFDTSIPKYSKSHYPNVPNLNTSDWREQYYGERGYKLLQSVKEIWDPSDFFYHSQSITVDIDKDSAHSGSRGDSDSSSEEDEIDENNESNSNSNNAINDIKSQKVNLRDDVYPQFQSKFQVESKDENTSMKNNTTKENYYLTIETEIFGSKNKNKNKNKSNNKNGGTKLRQNCVAMYDRSANKDPRNFLDVTRIFGKMLNALKSSVEKLKTLVSDIFRVKVRSCLSEAMT